MKIDFIETKTNCPIALVDCFFSEEELSLVKKELHVLVEFVDKQNNNVKDLKSATDEFNNVKRIGKSLFIDDFYGSNRNQSNILKFNRKIFFDKNLMETLEKQSIFYRSIKLSNCDFTLLNLYKKDDYYKVHHDSSLFTIIMFFDLYSFCGGDLVFPEFNKVIDFLDNRAVIFPGFLAHEVTKVTDGTRVTLAHFINYQ
jgi:hypothetical protein